MESVRTAKHMYILSINIYSDFDDDSRILLIPDRSCTLVSDDQCLSEQLWQRHEQIHKNDRDTELRWLIFVSFI